MSHSEAATTSRPAVQRDVLRAVLFAAGIVVAMLALTAAFGAQQGPSYDILPDPAHLSGLPF